MKAYTYSEARENFASVLEPNAMGRSRFDGAVFRIQPAPKSKSLPLDVPGVKLKVGTEGLVAAVREGRERSRR
jgi:hypothetical protein